MKILYYGRNSFRLRTQNTVIYIDPYAPGDYSLLADIILVTHQHRDHNQIELVNKNSNTIVISNYEAINENKYNTFNVKNCFIEAVEFAYSLLARFMI